MADPNMQHASENDGLAGPDDTGLLSPFSHGPSMLTDDMPTVTDPSHLDISSASRFPTQPDPTAVVGLHSSLPDGISLPGAGMGDASPTPAALAAAGLGVAQAQDASGGAQMKGKKPERNPVKGTDGLYRCQWSGCDDEVRAFSRKCEWNKHMDKHERPYRCNEVGCEKLIGFTYSGGLMRHEREVHGKHGGPKNTVNCPHENCKRHTGKGFSRQENLNEHLRRVHAEGASGPDGARASSSSINGTPSPPDLDELSRKAGTKRKREASDDEDTAETRIRRLERENAELRELLGSLRRENDEFKMQLGVLQQAFNAQPIQNPDPTLDAVQDDQPL